MDVYRSSCCCVGLLTAYKSVYWSSPPFLDERLLRDLLRLPADFLLPLRDFLPLRLRLADFLLGAAFLREPRLFGAILMSEVRYAEGAAVECA